MKLLTFHSSKGLEFPVVFIPFLESMPYMRDDIPGEAKLLYVGMTRAMDRLVADSPRRFALCGRGVRGARGLSAFLFQSLGGF